MKAVIAGAGIGGLAASLALARSGWAVILVEQSPSPGEFGAGIQVSPNGMRALDALGVGEAARAAGFHPRALEMRRGDTGAVIFSIPAGDAAVRRYGADYLNIHRGDLHAILLDAVRTHPGIELLTGERVLGAVQDAHSASLTGEGGVLVSGDIAIGADGIHSVVRAAMGHDAPPHFTGCSAWRLTVPAADLPPGRIPPAATVWAGKGRHAVTYYLRGGELVNFVGVVETPAWTRESWQEAGDVTELRADFAGFAAPVRDLLSAALACRRWALFDREPLPFWSQGRLTLLGDACHAMPPFLAQGAVMALEDSVILARRLQADRGDPARALAAYDASRRSRAYRVLAGARRNARLFHLSGLPARLTHLALHSAWRVSPGFIASQQEWLYRYDPTQA